MIDLKYFFSIFTYIFKIYIFAIYENKKIPDIIQREKKSKAEKGEKERRNLKETNITQKENEQIYQKMECI